MTTTTMMWRNNYLRHQPLGPASCTVEPFGRERRRCILPFQSRPGDLRRILSHNVLRCREMCMSELQQMMISIWPSWGYWCSGAGLVECVGGVLVLLCWKEFVCLARGFIWGVFLPIEIWRRRNVKLERRLLRIPSATAKRL